MSPASLFLGCGLSLPPTSTSLQAVSFPWHLDPHLFCCLPSQLDFESSQTLPSQHWGVISVVAALAFQAVWLALAAAVRITSAEVFDLCLS